DHELRMELNLSASPEVEDNHYTNIYYLPPSPPTFDNTLLKSRDNQQELTVDYTNPLTEDSKLEAGYDGSFSQAGMNLHAEYYDTNQKVFLKDGTRLNLFKFNQAIHAFYGTYQHSFGSFGYSAGLRLEQAFIRSDLVSKDSSIDNNYFKIYPTLHLSYKLKK